MRYIYTQCQNKSLPPPPLLTTTNKTLQLSHFIIELIAARVNRIVLNQKHTKKHLSMPLFYTLHYLNPPLTHTVSRTVTHTLTHTQSHTQKKSHHIKHQSNSSSQLHIKVTKCKQKTEAQKREPSYCINQATVKKKKKKRAPSQIAYKIPSRFNFFLPPMCQKYQKKSHRPN